MIRRVADQRRKGTILPLLAVCMIGLFGFCGLAIDLGLIAVSRTQCQNAADTAALSACRLLNSKPGSVNSNLAPAVAGGKVRVLSNTNLNQAFVNAHIKKIEAGQYLYDTSAEIFRVATWTDVTTNQSATPVGGGAWTAIRVTLSVNQPTYFMRAFGVNGMPTGAVATAVFKPRDVAFVLDMTGSMGFGSTFNTNGRSLNPDNLVPTFGHYVNVPAGNGTGSTVLRATRNQISGDYVYALSNFTITTAGGPPIIRNFLFDPVNLPSATDTDAQKATKMAVSAFPLTAAPSKNAFHRWSPSESGADPDAYPPVPPTYNFAGYNAFHTGVEATPMGPTPAPATFGTMTGNDYVGDRWRRADGSINKTDATWTGSSNKAAINAIDLLGYNVSSGNVRGGTGSTTITTVTKFRDPAWETYGYDLDIYDYRSTKGNGNPSSTYSTLVPAEDRFKGYSMGPGYWGKTFFIWPPDPRTPVGNPGDASYVPGDWRRRYLTQSNGSALDPQNDNLSSTTGVGNIESINEAIMNTGSGMVLTSGNGTRWNINYPAVLKWIKSGPLVLPPNLRAGRVLYYSSIPDDVNTATGSAQVQLDKAWWKNYIDYVLAFNITSTGFLYGAADSWSATGASQNVNASDMEQWSGPSGGWSNVRPYMAYTDSPRRPRLHFWFGPLSMVAFMQKVANWLPGTGNESQCWQLKAGMNSVLDDIKNNHPNNHAGLVMFSSSFNNIRRPMGKNYDSLKNALFYPKNLLDTIDLNNGGTSITDEYRPYNTSFSNLSNDTIPCSTGSTDPVTGLAYAYNLFSPSPSLPYTTKGRRGSAKIVIFETDGVPNATRSFTLTQQGYNSFYPTAGGASGTDIPTAGTAAVNIVKQLVKPMATSTSGDSGMTLPNAPCRVYPIAFGDLFDASLNAGAATSRDAALGFLADIAEFGNTGPAGATTIPTSQIITGTFPVRISTLKTGLENIFQAGVGVTLVE